MRLTVLTVLLATAGTPAIAADPFAPGPSAPIGSDVDLSLRLGLGALVQPDYEGSDDYHVVPWPIISLEFLRLPGIGEFGGPSSGFSIGPSFNIQGSRKESDNEALAGLGDVDTAVELGAKMSYETDMFGAFLAVRQGFGGHEGVVGEAGLNLIMNPTDRLSFIAGPRVSAASSDFFDTYYSVTPGQAAASGLPAYDASAGFKSVGVAAEAIYNLTDLVDLHVEAGWSRLVGDAAGSPIVERAGSKDQFTVGAGLSYRLDLNLFD
ncbi:MipA/OmpV family protein [Lutibaculum baratangense]|uniref:MltA-interacting MipA n=1 Tax=Lutibaculum baratangense AMV1 TaxID=631454 RepID=V4QSC1_9HYPH|nr:MipA/OmpV family protein [Lutibaculum baratangense]ESR22677.1 MltA-interacting MipA [Lutibaculum baratangense AMV1]